MTRSLAAALLCALFVVNLASPAEARHRHKRHHHHHHQLQANEPTFDF
jgi:hypothetical protein